MDTVFFSGWEVFGRWAISVGERSYAWPSFDSSFNKELISSVVNQLHVHMKVRCLSVYTVWSLVSACSSQYKMPVEIELHFSDVETGNVQKTINSCRCQFDIHFFAELTTAIVLKETYTHKHYFKTLFFMSTGIQLNTTYVSPVFWQMPTDIRLKLELSSQVLRQLPAGTKHHITHTNSEV